MYTNKYFKEIILTRTMTELSRREKPVRFDHDIFEKAYTKARSWMNQAYGSADLEEYINECGGSIASHYDDVLSIQARKEVVYG